MANFIGMVFATLKNKYNIDISDMSTDDAIKKFNELEKTDKESLREQEKAEHSKDNQEKKEVEPTPAEKEKLKEKGVEVEDSKEETDTKSFEEIHNEIWQYMKNKKRPLYQKDGSERYTAYDKGNVYGDNTKDDVDDILEDALKDVPHKIDYSHSSEATYITLYDNTDNDDGFDKTKNRWRPIYKIRIGSHFKVGTSGGANTHLDWRDYETKEELIEELQFIAKTWSQIGIEEIE